ncbi:hypothetical protein [Roseinatronobacter bogoriensis]|uniref:NADH:ubiquinone oxidoreductase n=1 Tax=Roseinatronobacter bogoriensis subsp. barguzinensis TaxID=441209 RepID=A0A2K8K656_9RHOB|nr:hypothetical protein [Rhodobaca]ATX64942.1 NADH:ubiquinone oxidoreductase [Rhodobaca barguzinensis]MBB4208757.1 putative flap endonuclease-1-like 5' DNA nuclease [Rhodobaca bogoriensis DSM 18756]TDW37975.1 putative flap endonuclease-1-like 5' DNA nuclease [Rhodobaca barguzinensis]TDY69855.1 putative flap endonuclease-1-like 5' DNA nuclease [Rhodobaca bogoriensis DSM 18756]
MPNSEIKNAPPLYGWTIAIAAGAVATGVSFLAVGIEGNGSVGIGAVIALVVGVIFTIAETPPSKKPVQPTKQVTAKTAAAAPTAPAPAASPAAPAAAPVASASTSEVDEQTGVQPQALDAPVGQADDLKKITGVGPVLEGKLNDLGIYHFWQIAKWNEEEIAWVDGFLNFKGRIQRDEWIAQASKLAADSPAKPPA